MANSAGQSSPADLVGRVGRASKKPGPAQLEPWNWCVGRGIDFLSPDHETGPTRPMNHTSPIQVNIESNCVYFNQIVYILIKLHIL